MKKRKILETKAALRDRVLVELDDYVEVCVVSVNFDEPCIQLQPLHYKDKTINMPIPINLTASIEISTNNCNYQALKDLISNSLKYKVILGVKKNDK